MGCSDLRSRLDAWDGKAQLFLLRRGARESPKKIQLLCEPDLHEAAQFMAPPAMGFQPDERVRLELDPNDPGFDLRLAELARQALAHGQEGFAADDLRRLLSSKWEDPLLGAVDLDGARADANALGGREAKLILLSRRAAHAAFWPPVAAIG